jgi:hypothetical protein
MFPLEILVLASLRTSAIGTFAFILRLPVAIRLCLAPMFLLSADLGRAFARPLRPFLS